MLVFDPGVAVATTPNRIDPQSWADPAVAFDARAYSDVEVQLVGTITTPYQPQRSIDGTNYVSVSALDDAGASYATITAAGIYSLPGNGYLKFSAGAGAVVTRRAAA